MRKLSLILAALCAVALSCTKEAASSDPEVIVSEKTDAEVVEEIITKSSSKVDSLSVSDMGFYRNVHHLLTGLLPKYGVLPIIKPIYDQIKGCYQNDTLRVGLNDIHGHFKAAFNTWHYSDADDLQFVYPGVDGETVEHTIVCGDELTDSPLFSHGNIFIMMPKQIDATMVADKDTLSKSRLVSEIVSDGGFKDGSFEYSGMETDTLRSKGILKFVSSDSSINEMSLAYSIVDNGGKKVFGIDYVWEGTPVDKIVVTFDDRVHFRLDAKDIVSCIAIITLCNSQLEHDQSESTLESIKETIEEANRELDVNFYLDGKIEGKLKFALVQDNGIYAVDLVMVYEKDGTEYQVKNVVPAAKALIGRVSSFIEIFNDIKDYIEAHL